MGDKNEYNTYLLAVKTKMSQDLITVLISG